MLSKKIFESAKDNANLYALKIGNERTTYRELTTLSLRIASILVKMGAASEPIGLVGQRELSVYAGVLGILYAGCPYVPINSKSSPDKIISVISATKIRFLVGSFKDLQAIELLLLENKRSDLIANYICPFEIEGRSTKWVNSNECSNERILCAPVSRGPSDIAYILFTSGSSGVPKGVKVTHSNVCAYLDAVTKFWSLPKGYRASQFYDMSFDLSVSDLFATWTNRGELCVLPECDLLAPFDFIRREQINLWSSVPSVGIFMLKTGMLTEQSFPSLVVSWFCGEPFPKSLAVAWQQAAPNSTVENHYGPTEATIALSRHVYTPEQNAYQFAHGTVPIGNAFSGMEIEIIGEDGIPVKRGEKGQIVFKGLQISQGYLNDEEKTNASFVRFNWDDSGDTWYKSGDLGFVDEYGWLECLGRSDNQIKFSGKRVELGEIESHLSRYLTLKDIVIIPIRDANSIVTALVGFVTGGISKDELSFIRKDSQRFMDKLYFPKQIIAIERLPYAISGKVDRKKLASIASELLGPKS